jgi:hypothetical protein
MADEPADDPQRPRDEATGTEGGVKKLHYIVHVVSGTNQIIKVEELDEEAKTSRELPLPLFLSFEDDEDERAEEVEGELEYEFDWPPPQTPVFPPHAYGYHPGYYGYPPPSPFMPAPCIASPGRGPRFVMSPVDASEEATGGGPNLKFDARGPKVKPEFRGPKVRAEFRGPKVRSEFRGPKVTAEFRGPKVKPEFRGPKVNFGGGDPDNPAGPCWSVKFRSK